MDSGSMKLPISYTVNSIFSFIAIAGVATTAVGLIYGLPMVSKVSFLVTFDYKPVLILAGTLLFF